MAILITNILFYAIQSLLFVFVFTQTVPGPGSECLCFQRQNPTEGELYNPTKITHAGDGSERVFVSEQRGYIWIYNQDGLRNDLPFLNLTGSNELLVLSNAGLLTFAFHPDFVNNGLLYVAYNIQSMADGLYYHRISEMSLSKEDPNVVDLDSERHILNVFYNTTSEGHRGGMFVFGDDGYLYIAIGDGPCCNDPLENGQDKTTFHGSMLRIDVDSRTGNLPYGIPPDNPFLDEPGTLPEIYAFGLRNPWTGGIDTGDRSTGAGRGRLFVGDVGEAMFEEINFMEAGGNYGWSIYEGDHCHETEQCEGSFVSPIVSYNRTVGTCVVYGGIYHGCEMPNLDNWMVFTDYASKQFFGAVETSPGTWTTQIIPTCDTCPEGLTNDKQVFILTMGEDEQGEFYFGAVDARYPNDIGGNFYKLVDPNNAGVC